MTCHGAGRTGLPDRLRRTLLGTLPGPRDTNFTGTAH